MAFGVQDLLGHPDAARLLDAVRSGWTVAGEGDVLRGYFPGFSDRTIALGLDYYLRARQAATELMGLAESESLFRSDIPIKTSIGSAYEYTISIDFERPGAGRSRRETIVCEQAVNWSKGQVEQCGIDQLARMLRLEGRGSDYIAMSLESVAFITVETVFRRS